MASNSILEAKKQAVAEVSELIKNSVAGVVVNYQGITVADDTAMRKSLREAGVKYVVLKNSITGRACEAAGYGDIKACLNGMTAIAISEKDPIAAARILSGVAEKVESFKVLAGYVDGGVIGEAEVNALAKVPAKEVLIAKFLGSIKSPIYKLAYALKEVADKNGAAPAEAPAEA